jgi:hypothetical protein
MGDHQQRDVDGAMKQKQGTLDGVDAFLSV